MRHHNQVYCDWCWGKSQATAVLRLLWRSRAPKTGCVVPGGARRLSRGAISEALQKAWESLTFFRLLFSSSPFLSIYWRRVGYTALGNICKFMEQDGWALRPGADSNFQLCWLWLWTTPAFYFLEGCLYVWQGRRKQHVSMWPIIVRFWKGQVIII